MSEVEKWEPFEVEGVLFERLKLLLVAHYLRFTRLTLHGKHLPEPNPKI